MRNGEGIDGLIEETVGLTTMRNAWAVAAAGIEEAIEPVDEIDLGVVGDLVIVERIRLVGMTGTMIAEIGMTENEIEGMRMDMRIDVTGVTAIGIGRTSATRRTTAAGTGGVINTTTVATRMKSVVVDDVAAG